MSRAEREAQTELFGPDWVKRLDDLGLPVPDSLREAAFIPATYRSTPSPSAKPAPPPVPTPTGRKRSVAEYLDDGALDDENHYTSQIPGAFLHYGSPLNMTGSVRAAENNSVEQDKYRSFTHFSGGRFLLSPQRVRHRQASPPRPLPGAFPAMESPQSQEGEDGRAAAGVVRMPAGVINVALYNSHRMRKTGQRLVESVRPLLVQMYRGVQQLAGGTKRRLVQFAVKLYQGTSRYLEKLYQGRRATQAQAQAEAEAQAAANDVGTEATDADAAAADADAEAASIDEDSDPIVADLQAIEQPDRKAQRHRLMDERANATRRSIMRKSQGANLVLPLGESPLN